MPAIGTNKSKWPRGADKNETYMTELLTRYKQEEAVLKLGGGNKKIGGQHKKGRKTVRERVELLVDKGSPLLELGIYAGWEMYEEIGSPASAGLVLAIGKVSGRECVIIANDATVKAGAYFEVTLKKHLRGQRIALENNLPVIYLVDSAGVFLPLQDKVFPDEEHFGRIFYNNARLSAMGVSQIAVVMGPCVAGGAYLPVMCDKFVMTEGANMFVAGPALVKAAIGQEIDRETLGGATTHNAISGSADYHAKNDEDALEITRRIVKNLPNSEMGKFNRMEPAEPLLPAEDLNAIVPEDGGSYDMEEIVARVVDGSDFESYKSEYGKTVLCGNARIGGYAVGIVANQRTMVTSGDGEMQMGGVLYSDSSDKAARFIMNCNQDRIPIIFLHNVNGFMVGRKAEWGGILKDGAKMVQAVSNSVVPKITLIIGGSYGAGYYAMSGRAYSPRFMYLWPSASLAVMGGNQAAETLAEIQLSQRKNVSDKERNELINTIKDRYHRQSDPRYAAARMWTDAIIKPADTRQVLIHSLELCEHQSKMPAPVFGVLQV
ncbi:MAG: acyl-CoA carboxylase subunit beta [Candidatus Marinimicrobia bacterium]|nr:acyl-CoA carboxylase subunit beta [Candidatus Neomarinimicrobiota bacterium]